MNNFEPITYSEEFVAQYWEGTSNAIARYYSYLQRGFGLLNDAKYYILLVFGGFLTTDVHLPVWLVALMGALTLIILVLLGRWHLFKASKSIEFITQRHGSITGYNMYNMQVEMVRLLREINNKLSK